MENNEQLESENRAPILEILDGLRERVEHNEVLQVFIVAENSSGEFESLWSGTEDRMAISAFVIGSALVRMGFAKVPDPD